MAMETIGLGGVLKFAADKAVAGMGVAGRAFGKLQKNSISASDALGGFSTSARNAGLAAAAVGVGLGFAIRDAREFGKAVGEVSTIADEAEFPLETIRDLTKDMAVQFGTVPVDQAKALYQAISAGATDAAEATMLLDTANKLAIGGVSDTFTAIDVLTTATNAYAAAGLEAADASDVIFTTVRLGKTTVDELGASLGQVIPAAADLKVSFAELGAAMATITLGGISSAEASTALNAALLNIRKPSEQARKAAKDLGIEFNAAALKNKDLITVLSEAAEAAKGDDEAITALFGSVRALKAISVLTANEGKKFNEALTAMEGRAGATEEAFDKMSKTTDFQINRMNALRKASMTTLGEILEPLAIRVLKPLGRMAEKLFEILEAVRSDDFDKLGGRAAEIAKGISDAIDSISEKLTTVTGHFDKLGQAIDVSFGNSTREVSNFGTQFVLIMGVSGPVMLALAGLALFIKVTLIPLFTALGVTSAVAFWPILIPLAAIGLAFAVLGDDAWLFFAAFADVGKAMFGILTDFLFMPLRNVWNLATGVFEAIGMIFSGDIIGGLKRLGQAILDFMWEPFRTVVRTLIKMADLLTTTGKAEWIPTAVREFARAPTPELAKEGFKRAAGRGIAAGAPPPVAAMLPGVTPSQSIMDRMAEETAKSAKLGWEAQEKTAMAAEAARKAAEESAKASGSAEKAAKKKPCAKVEIDKREVGRAVAKHQDEVKTRSGFKATPYQRRQIVENGAIT